MVRPLVRPVISRPFALNAFALLLAFGSAITWHEDVHLAPAVPCLAHTPTS
jgi:hypothetical protein